MKVITTFIIKCAFVSFVQSQWHDQIPLIQPDMCRGMMDGIIFPDPDHCFAFVKCEQGQVTRRRCSAGSMFDLSLLYCVPAGLTDCGMRGQKEIPTNIQSPDFPSSESHHSVCRNMRNGAIIANPNNCRAFIECQQNLRLDRQCQNGELFEAHSGVCLSDFVVDCGDRNFSPPIDDVAIRALCLGQPNGVLISDPRSCGRFFVCQNRQAIPQECRPGELFEENRSLCMSARNVNCGSRGSANNIDLLVPPMLNVNGEVTENVCNNLPTGTRISNPQNCRNFHECRNGQRFDIDCPNSQAFDVTTSQCRSASTVNCGSRRSLGGDAFQNVICQGQRNGRRLGNPNNCRAFIECQDNTRNDRTCEAGELFDTSLETCLPSHLVRCGARGLAPDSPQSPEDFFPACPRTGVSFRHHPHDCQGYFICAEGNLIKHSCAPGIHFNPRTLQCDMPPNAQCQPRRIVVPQTPIIPDCREGENFFPNLVNCKQYFICIDRLPKLMDCPDSFVWNNQRLRCERSPTGECGGFN